VRALCRWEAKVVGAVSALSDAIDEGMREPHARGALRVGSPELMGELAKEKIRQQRKSRSHAGPAQLAAHKKAYGHLHMHMPHLHIHMPHVSNMFFGKGHSGSHSEKGGESKMEEHSFRSARNLLGAAAKIGGSARGLFVSGPSVPHKRRLSREVEKSEAANKIEAVMRGRMLRQQTQALKQAKHSERLLNIRFVFLHILKQSYSATAHTVHAPDAICAHSSYGVCALGVV
jgi:nitrate reductase NapAB chaperone NapD